jgi:hypothetical protein
LEILVLSHTEKPLPCAINSAKHCPPKQLRRVRLVLRGLRSDPAQSYAATNIKLLQKLTTDQCMLISDAPPQVSYICGLIESVFIGMTNSFLLDFGTVHYSLGTKNQSLVCLWIYVLSILPFSQLLLPRAVILADFPISVLTFSVRPFFIYFFVGTRNPAQH